MKESKKQLSVNETVYASATLKAFFEKQLCSRLTLVPTHAPLFIKSGLGFQDELSGTEEAVKFVAQGRQYEVVHSLAKWKRMALNQYNFNVGEGIVCNMRAIRKDEVQDHLHSYLVDQWDFEKIINEEDKTIETLKLTVQSIYKSIRQTNKYIKSKYPFLTQKLAKTVYFIHSQQLEDMYPTASAIEREQLICETYGTVFVYAIGDCLRSGKPHGTRSPDYDDWTLNGDLLIYSNILNKPIEMLSMGIRVDAQALRQQLIKSDQSSRSKQNYHQMILNNQLPLTIGGGIGQARLCMLLLDKQHIDEVQAFM